MNTTDRERWGRSEREILKKTDKESKRQGQSQREAERKKNVQTAGKIKTQWKMGIDGLWFRSVSSDGSHEPICDFPENLPESLFFLRLSVKQATREKQNVSGDVNVSETFLQAYALRYGVIALKMWCDFDKNLLQFSIFCYFQPCPAQTLSFLWSTTKMFPAW